MKNTPPIMRAIYIVLVPIVLLIILLNSGMLQRFLPACTISGRTMRVVDYNYYYFDYYNSYLEEHEAELTQLGYDPNLEDSKQLYDGEITWKEFFQREAEQNIAETAYYCDLAESAGYEFTPEELAPVEEKLSENRAFFQSMNLSAGNYYISYYGSGMTEEIFTRHLTNQVKAEAYKAHLLTTMTNAAVASQSGDSTASPADAENGDYRAVDLIVITLDALPDRETGEIGKAQLEALEKKLNELASRHENGTELNALQQAFSTCRLGDENGCVIGATETDLPPVLAEKCLAGQAELSKGDTLSCIDKENGIAYYAQLTGFGISGPEKDAAARQAMDALEEQENEALPANYTVHRSAVGMLLATG